jgi:hypothetical protein
MLGVKLLLENNVPFSFVVNVKLLRVVFEESNNDKRTAELFTSTVELDVGVEVMFLRYPVIGMFSFGPNTYFDTTSCISYVVAAKPREESNKTNENAIIKWIFFVIYSAFL